MNLISGTQLRCFMGKKILDFVSWGRKSEGGERGELNATQFCTPLIISATFTAHERAVMSISAGHCYHLSFEIAVL